VDVLFQNESLSIFGIRVCVKTRIRAVANYEYTTLPTVESVIFIGAHKSFGNFYILSTDVAR